MTTLITAAKETIDNKDYKTDFRAQRFSRKHGLVGVPILASPQTWFQSLLFKDYGFS